MDLISREATVAVIEAAKRDFSEHKFAIDNYSACVGPSRAVLEVSALLSPWVSAKDRLPENGSICLVCGKKGGIRVARFYSATAEWTVVGTGKPFNATHWMELPAPPAD